jgi:hypothetical protein
VRQELPVSPALRNVRFIYFNPVDGSLRVSIIVCRHLLFPRCRCGCWIQLTVKITCEFTFLTLCVDFAIQSLPFILQVCGINNSDLSPLLCSPRAFRELLVSNLLIGSSRASSTFVSLTQSASARSSVTGSNSSAAAGSASRLKRVAAAVVDRLTDKQGFKFPAGSALLAGTFVICSLLCARFAFC